MMMAAILLAMQAGPPSAETLAAHPPIVATPPQTVPHRVAIDPAQAIDLFRSLCLRNMLDAAAFAASAAASTQVAFTSVPRTDAGPGQVWRADRALVTYGTARDGSTRCTLLGRTGANVDQLAFSAKVAEALALKTGRTRTGKGQGVTDWSAAGPDGRAVQISAATRNGPGGGTDLRLSAALGR